MKWIVLIAGMIAMGNTAPVAEPEAFFLPAGPLAIPALTGVSLIDGLLLGKVALLKAAILANLLLDQGEEVAPASDYVPLLKPMVPPRKPMAPLQYPMNPPLPPLLTNTLSLLSLPTRWPNLCTRPLPP